MADKDDSTTSFPLPPIYAANYSQENFAKYGAPPPPPPPQEWSCFGVKYSLNDELVPTFESQSIQRLTPVHCDRKKELKKLNMSVLFSFIDLVEILIEAPDAPRIKDKLKDIELMMLNMHQLINEMRPHQALETLRVMMELQKRQRVEAGERLNVVMDCARNMLLTTARPTLNEAAEGPITAVDGKTDDDVAWFSGAAGQRVEAGERLKVVMDCARNMLLTTARPTVNEAAEGPKIAVDDDSDDDVARFSGAAGPVKSDEQLKVLMERAAKLLSMHSPGPNPSGAAEPSEAEAEVGNISASPVKVYGPLTFVEYLDDLLKHCEKFLKD